VYLGVLKILTTPDVAELRIQSGTHTRMPINCGTQVRAVDGVPATRRRSIREVKGGAVRGQCGDEVDSAFLLRG